MIIFCKNVTFSFMHQRWTQTVIQLQFLPAFLPPFPFWRTNRGNLGFPGFLLVSILADLTSPRASTSGGSCLMAVVWGKGSSDSSCRLLFDLGISAACGGKLFFPTSATVDTSSADTRRSSGSGLANTAGYDHTFFLNSRCSQMWCSSLEMDSRKLPWVVSEKARPLYLSLNSCCSLEEKPSSLW